MFDFDQWKLGGKASLALTFFFLKYFCKSFVESLLNCLHCYWRRFILYRDHSIFLVSSSNRRSNHCLEQYSYWTSLLCVKQHWNKQVHGDKDGLPDCNHLSPLKGEFKSVPWIWRWTGVWFNTCVACVLYTTTRCVQEPASWFHNPCLWSKQICCPNALVYFAILPCKHFK